MVSRNGPAKGVRIEARAKRCLEQQGYTVHRTIRAPYYARGAWGSNSNDVFGCIDLVAKRAGERTRWIQCMSGRHVGAKRRDLAAIPWTLEHDSVEIWRWVPGTGKRIDGRTGAPRVTQYFQVYRADFDFALRKHDRVHDQ